MTGTDAARTALVTGATGGIGRAVADRLAAAGLRVLGVGRDVARGSALTAELAAVPGTGHRFLPTDLALLAETQNLADRVLTETPRLDAVVCAAGNFAWRPEWTGRDWNGPWC